MNAMLLLAMMAPSSLAPAAFPLAFQGEWETNRDCRGGPSDNGKMRITANKIAKFDVVGDVARVETLDASTVRVETLYANDRLQFTSIINYSISKDGQKLTAGELGDTCTYKRHKK